ncbi:DNA topoisomerase 1, partial [Ceratobasidium sp. 423]
MAGFRLMFKYFKAEKPRRRPQPPPQTAKPKPKDKGTGRPEKVGNFMIELPSLFRGGRHPKTGKDKYRLRLEDITIDIGQNALIPVPKAVPSKARATRKSLKGMGAQGHATKDMYEHVLKNNPNHMKVQELEWLYHIT